VNPKRWQMLKTIFENALEKDASSRSAYLDEACGMDIALRSEAAALLARHNEDDFLEKPAYAAVPELFENEPDPIEIGAKIGPYEIRSKLGSGGMGIVYLGHDTRLDRRVAVKALAPFRPFLSQQKERFRTEARAAAKLTHPGIATIYSLEECEGRLYMISEYVHGRTLREIITNGRLSFSQIIDFAVQMAQALTNAHENGIIHRDLKPENIMVTDSGNVKILDFGLARIESKESGKSAMPLTLSGQFFGTPAYASPEQLIGNPTDRAADIFSFGIVLFELSTGRHPFHSDHSIATIAKILEADVPELRQWNPEIPNEFLHIVDSCLKKNPADRYAQTRDLLVDLNNIYENKVPDSPHSSATLWWWQFHQACAGFGYYGMLYPLWKVKEWLGGIEGSLLFFPALIAVGISANLRFHLWFTSRFYRSELTEQRSRVSSWIRRADCLFVFMLAWTAIRIHSIHAIIATLLMAVAIGALVAFTLIEPVTERAALDR
jgi:eukaryotic-like serine/threonine-protein kinase